MTWPYLKANFFSLEGKKGRSNNNNMCVSFLPNLESVKCLECKAFAQFFLKSFLTSILEKKRERVLFHLKFFKVYGWCAQKQVGGLVFKFRKNARNWLKSESVWNSFYLCFYITLCLWCQFLFRNNNRGSILLFFFASFYESIREKTIKLFISANDVCIKKDWKFHLLLEIFFAIFKTNSKVFFFSL